MQTRIFVRGLVLAGAVASFLHLPSPFIARAQAETAAADASARASVAMASNGIAPQQMRTDAKASCADERDAVDAHKNEPGSSLVIARTDLAACEGKAAP